MHKCQLYSSKNCGRNTKNIQRDIFFLFGTCQYYSYINECLMFMKLEKLSDEEQERAQSLGEVVLIWQCCLV